MPTFVAVADDALAVVVSVLLSSDAVGRAERLDESIVEVSVELPSEPPSVEVVAMGRSDVRTEVADSVGFSGNESVVLAASVEPVAAEDAAEATEVDAAEAEPEANTDTEVAEGALPADKRLNAS